MTSKKGNGNDKSNNKCNPPFTMKPWRVDHPAVKRSAEERGWLGYAA